MCHSIIKEKQKKMNQTMSKTTAVAAMKKMVILVDNGHGRETMGKKSPDGSLQEWAWNREIAARVVADLRSQGIDARLLVKETYDVPLRERVRRANQVCDTYGADKVMLVSVHVNAAGNGREWRDARGWSVWISKKAGSKSKAFAQLIYDHAYCRGLKGNRYVPKEHYWQADYTIVTNTKCPAVLTENMFMDNKEDCAWLLSEAGKQTIVDVHVEAIKEWLK